MIPKKQVTIGNLTVGEGFPPLFMAEIGTFFNQDIDKAESLLSAAIKNGAAILKTEILHNPDICLKDTGLKTEYNHATGTRTEDYRSLIERKVVSLSDYARLFTLCRKNNYPFVASVYDVEGVDFLFEQGGAAIKIARDSINNIPLIRHSAATNLPVIFDVANHYLEEIARAVRLVLDHGKGGVIINHHPARNPAPAERHNLKIIQTYKHIFNVPVGLSCHFRGDAMIYPAIAVGASLIEKGVFDDIDAAEQDVVSALEVSKISAVVSSMEECWASLGDGLIKVEEPRDQSTWKGIVAKRDIARGEVLSGENLGFAWPPKGISVGDWDVVEGKKSSIDISKNSAIGWEMITG